MTSYQFLEGLNLLKFVSGELAFVNKNVFSSVKNSKIYLALRLHHDAINPLMTLVPKWRSIVLSFMFVRPIVSEELKHTDRQSYACMI